MSVTVFPMRPEWVSASAALLVTCFPGGVGEDAVTAGLVNEANRYFCAVKDGVVVGCAGYCAAADQADIIEVAVLPAFRRQGIARLLMEAVLSDARQRNVQSVFLEARASNVPAIALYESLSFQRCGVRKNYYSSPREDAVLMYRAFGGTSE